MMLVVLFVSPLRRAHCYSIPFSRFMSLCVFPCCCLSPDPHQPCEAACWPWRRNHQGHPAQEQVSRRLQPGMVHGAVHPVQRLSCKGFEHGCRGVLSSMQLTLQ